MAHHESVAQQGDARVGELEGADARPRPNGPTPHRVSFQPATSNVGEARRALYDVLTDAGRAEFADAATLALSELVTNAVLHAHTPVELCIDIRPDRLRVEVRDHNPVMPVERSYDNQATTGRGMALVAALTTSCGVVSLGSKGKVVWFELEFAAPERSEDELLAAWGDTDDWDLQAEPDEPEPEPEVTRVTLLRVSTLR